MRSLNLITQSKLAWEQIKHIQTLINQGAPPLTLVEAHLTAATSESMLVTSDYSRGILKRTIILMEELPDDLYLAITPLDIEWIENINIGLGVQTRRLFQEIPNDPNNQAKTKSIIFTFCFSCF